MRTGSRCRLPYFPGDCDELLRPDTTLERLASLKPAFKAGGTVTAGNASPYSDGAAAVLLMSREQAEARGLTPLARFVTYAVGGVDPDIMGIAPIKAAAAKMAVSLAGNPAAESGEPRSQALVFDASGVSSPAQLREVYDFFQPLVRSIPGNGRVVILSRAPESCTDVGRKTASTALRGFMRSLAKEVGKKAERKARDISKKAEHKAEETARAESRQAAVEVKFGAGAEVRFNDRWGVQLGATYLQGVWEGIAGVGQVLKKEMPHVLIAAVEPVISPHSFSIGMAVTETSILRREVGLASRCWKPRTVWPRRARRATPARKPEALGRMASL